MYINCILLQGTGESARSKLGNLIALAFYEVDKFYSLLQQTEETYTDAVPGTGSYNWAIAGLDLYHARSFNIFRSSRDRRLDLDHVVVYFRRAFHTVKDTIEIREYNLEHSDFINAVAVADESSNRLASSLRRLAIDPRTTLAEDAENRAGETKTK